MLTARCLKCHGNAKAEGGLHFTEREGAIAELESGKHAIVPGEPDKSEMVRRVTATDESERMPPEGPALKEKKSPCCARGLPPAPTGPFIGLTVPSPRWKCPA